MKKILKQEESQKKKFRVAKIKTKPKLRRASVKVPKSKKWQMRNEKYMRNHINEMRVRLAHHSRTAPWKKVMMGSCGILSQIEKDQQLLEECKLSPQQLSNLPYDQYKKYQTNLTQINDRADRMYRNNKLRSLKSVQKESISSEKVEKYL